jgi:hypothetical protein
MKLAYAYLAGANLEGIHPITLAELEEWDSALPAVKSTRRRVEYYFTCALELLLYVMDRSGCRRRHVPRCGSVLLPRSMSDVR